MKTVSLASLLAVDCASSIFIFSVCEGNVELHGGGNVTDEIGEL